jgi:hypothetical protein
MASWAGQGSLTNTRPNNLVYPGIEALYAELPPLPSFVASEVARIRDGAPFILIAHQPVLFPYEAVVLNYALLHSIAGFVRPTPPCIIHLIMDTDGADERAFHRTKYPTASTKQGFITLRADAGAHWTGWTCNALRAPDSGALARILDDLTAAVQREWRLAGGRRFNCERLEQIRFSLQAASARGNLLTTFMINILADYAWTYLGIPIVFVRYSAVLRSGDAFIAELAADRHQYHALLRATEDAMGSTQKLVPESADHLFWTHCSRCWTRRTFSSNECIDHECVHHAQSHRQRGHGNQRSAISIVPKVLMEDIFIRTCLKPLAIVNYRGGQAHAAVAVETLKALGRPQPPTLTWGSGWLSDGPIELLHARGGSAPGKQGALDLIHSGRASMLYAWSHADAEAKLLHFQSLLQSEVIGKPIPASWQRREMGD